MNTSARLRQATSIASKADRPALAALFAHEAVLAAEAEHLASVASDTVMTSISPSYRPVTVLAVSIALEEWPDLAAEWEAAPW